MNKIQFQSVFVCSITVFCSLLLVYGTIFGAGKISIIDNFTSTQTITPYSYGMDISSDSEIIGNQIKDKNDGRFAAFSSPKSFSCPTNDTTCIPDTNGRPDIYLVDRKYPAKFYLASLIANLSGGQPSQFTQCSSLLPSIALFYTGNEKRLRVAFQCANPNTFFLTYIYVTEFRIQEPSAQDSRSFVLLKTYNISCKLNDGSNGLCEEGQTQPTQTRYGGTETPEISGDGRFVVFQTPFKITQGSGDNTYEGISNIYARDLNNNFPIKLISRTSSTGNFPTFGNSVRPSISYDGSNVVFQSTSFDSPSTTKQIMLGSALFDIVPQIVSKTPSNQFGNDNSECDDSEQNQEFVASVNNNKLIVFHSKATNLGVPAGECGLILRDELNNTTTVLDSILPHPSYKTLFGGHISDNGRFIIYAKHREAYVYDRVSGIKRKFYETQIDGSSRNTDSRINISKDGRFAIFLSNSSLTYGEPSGNNVFVHDLIRLTDKSSGDFNADGQTDLGVFRPSTNFWYTLESPNYSPSTYLEQQFGASNDLTVPGDFDGDGKTDYAVFTPSTGTWSYKSSFNPATTNTFNFGTATDIPVAADYDGDNKTDYAYFRPSNGTWYIQQSSAGLQTVNFGLSGDKPVPSDYDNDGKADIAVYRPSNGTWYLLNSHDNSFYGAAWGNSGDIPIPMDINGDGKSELGVWRPSNGVWHFFNIHSSNNPYTIFAFGQTGDKPVPGDYDNDGKMDAGVFRPSTQQWFILKSSNNSLLAASWGLSTDVPIAYGNLNP